MASQGLLHSDIAKSLDISLMTYHRWRKARALSASARDAAGAHSSVGREQMNQITDLQIENSRLRTLVTDLLLEKVKLTERLRSGDDTAMKKGWAQ
jgi:hypothetical protein